MLHSLKTFSSDFFSVDYPSGCRVQFSCKHARHSPTIIFKATSKKFQYVLSVYETNRDDCRVMIDATRKHYTSGLQVEAKQVGTASVGASKIQDYRTSIGWIWKLGFQEVCNKDRTSSQFAAMCETDDFLVEVSGFATPATANEVEEAVTHLLESLRIDARNTWRFLE